MSGFVKIDGGGVQVGNCTVCVSERTGKRKLSSID